MFRYAFVGIVSLAASVFAYAQSRKKAPEWTVRSPADGLYYYGIGISGIDEKGEYRDVAREMAVREIAEKIRVQISSTSALKSTATDVSHSYLLNTDIQSYTFNSFEDLRLEEDWHDPSSGTYYALYKLNIDQYRQRRRQYADLVLNAVADYIDRSEKAYAEGYYDRAFRYLEEALNTLQPDLHRPVELEYQTRLRMAEFEIEQVLEQEIYSLQVTTDQPIYEFDPLGKGPQRIHLTVLNGFPGPEAEKLPIIIRELKGDVFDYEWVHTGHGMALDVYGLLPEESEALIQLYPDLPLELARRFADNHYPLLSEPLVVRFKPVYFKMLVHEDIMGKPSGSDFLHDFFADFLEHCSVYEANAGQNPGYRMQIKTVIDPIASSGSNKAVSFTIYLEIVEDGSAGVAYQKELDHIRGYGLSYRAAVKSAYDHFVYAADPILEDLIQVLCKRKL